jgi:hypothetical protein
MFMQILSVIILCGFLCQLSCKPEKKFSNEQDELFKSLAAKGSIACEGYNRCLRFVYGWLELADSTTGLIPRNINDSISKDIWNAMDCAADNYPFMVLTSALLSQDLFIGRMTDMLHTETRLTSRLFCAKDTQN